MYRACEASAETSVHRDHGVMTTYSLKVDPETAPKRASRSQVPTLARMMWVASNLGNDWNLADLQLCLELEHIIVQGLSSVAFQRAQMRSYYLTSETQFGSRNDV